MDFTFGIITFGNKNLQSIIDSIHTQNIPNYEIIIVGDCIFDLHSRITNIKFDESQKQNWITKKKNIICEKAKYENIVLLHDYISFDENWYQGFLKFGNNWDWGVCKIFNKDNSRFRDYTLFPYFNWWAGKSFTPEHTNNLLPYNFINNKKWNKYMYISGSFYFIKKHIALRFPLNENLVWGQSEDIELSIKLHNSDIMISFNPYSSVHLQKQQWQHHSFNNEISKNELSILENQI